MHQKVFSSIFVVKAVVFILQLLFMEILSRDFYDYYNNSTTQTFFSGGAFCSPSGPFQFNFPSELPEEPLPWVWDAVYQQSSRRIIITTIPRKNCLLEFNIVEYFLELFPKYGIYT